MIEKMNILIIGGGGREHALTWKIAQSPLVEKLYIAPGNAGTASLGSNVPIDAEDIDQLLAFAQDKKIGLTVVGPEAPLAAGLVDRFTDAGLLAFGPSQKAAQLEASKAFMKQILDDAQVPTARYEVHTDRDAAVACLDRLGGVAVVKADGLAAGKGVVVATTRDEAVAAIDAALFDKTFGDAGAKLVIEEFLPGEEASILAFCDGEKVIMMPASQDHKRIGEGDTGPNTGGMGAYSPAPVVTEDMIPGIKKDIIEATAASLKQAGAPYRGILYAGLMIAPDGTIKVLEFNCRFGDPECQPIMARMTSDIVPVLIGCAKGDLGDVNVTWSDDAAICVVMAAGGYPGSYEKGKPIFGIDEANSVEGVTVFHAGTALADSGSVVTSGGRVLGVTATGTTIQEALRAVYAGVNKISWEGCQYRRDIAYRAIDRGDA
jgi:phosphoribosylamine--glycine ligase